MNVTLSNSSSAAVPANGGANATGQKSGVGFAGALVQAIGGGNQAAGDATGSQALPGGLNGLFGMPSVESAEEGSDNLLSLIAKLVEQIDQLENEEANIEASEGVMSSLSEMLILLQGMLQQLEQTQPNGTAKPLESTGSSDSSKQLTHALRESLLQLSALLTDDHSGSVKQDASSFIGQLKLLLDQLSKPQATPMQHVSSSETQQDALDSSNKSTHPAHPAVVVPTKESTAQAVVIQETRRPLQLMRDPIWNPNYTAAQEEAASEDLKVILPTASSENVGDSTSQPNLMLMRQEGLPAPDTVQGKVALPAQVPVPQFTQHIEKFLVKQFLLTQGNGASEARITLTPEHLGQVDIRIIMQNGIVTAQFMTENGMARELLDSQMSQLRSALHSQGLQVDRLEVVQQPAQTANTSFLNQDHRQPNSGNYGQGANGRGKNGYEDPALFAAELERNEGLREFGYGSSLNVTA